MNIRKIPPLLATCSPRRLEVNFADDPDFETRFCTVLLEFGMCAQAFHPRIGPQLVGRVAWVAGGLAASGRD